MSDPEHPDTQRAQRDAPAGPRAALPAPRSDFIGLAGKVHLATGGEPPLLVAHRAAFERFARDKAEGHAGYWRHWETVDAVRAHLGRWLGLEAGDVALLGNASEGIMRVVAALDWRDGDNVVVPELDYASGRFALASLRPRGVEVRLVPAEGWTMDEDRLVAACDARTRLVYVSQVNALTGQHVDLERISAGLGDAPALLLVDASHALGAVPVPGRLADFVTSCTYKFALGIHEGVLAWNRQRRPDFAFAGAGWCSATQGATPGEFVPRPDARQAEYGNVGHLGAYLLAESLAYIDAFGIEAVAAHVRGLSGRMVEGLDALGLDVMTPPEPARRAGNAAFAHAGAGEIMRRAAAEGFLVWADNGRVRASAHLFTSDDDVARFLERLPEFLP